jgi:hypothetical protein
MRTRISTALDFAPTDDRGKRFLTTVAILLSGKGTTVTGVDDVAVPEILTLPLPPETEEDLACYAGDAAFAIPSDYPVSALQEWNKLPATTERQNQEAKVLLMTTTRFLSKAMRTKMMGVLAPVGAIICDEARWKKPEDFQFPVLESGGARPLIIGASSINYHKWPCVSPSCTLSESIGRTLPGVRVNLTPSQEQEHFESESDGAIEQLFQQHFADIRALPGKQPREMDTLLIVASRSTRKVARALRERYARTTLQAQVYCFDGQSRESRVTGKSQKTILEAWFTRARPEGPNILVTTPSMASDAMDLPNIENLTIGAPIGKDVLLRLLGRAFHSNRHRTEGPDYAVYVCQQQFARSHLGITPFFVLKHGQDHLDLRQGFPWVPGQVLMPKELHDREARRLQRNEIPTIKVPSMLSGGTPEQNGCLRSQENGAVKRSKQIVLPLVAEAYTDHNGGGLPNERMVESYLTMLKIDDYLKNYLASLTITAQEAYRRNAPWKDAVRKKLNDLEKRAARYARISPKDRIHVEPFG